MDNNLLVAGIIAIVYLLIDYGKFYYTYKSVIKDKPRYKISTTIPAMIVVFIIALVVLNLYFRKKVSNVERTLSTGFYEKDAVDI